MTMCSKDTMHSFHKVSFTAPLKCDQNKVLSVVLDGGSALPSTLAVRFYHRFMSRDLLAFVIRTYVVIEIKSFTCGMVSLLQETYYGFCSSCMEI